MTTSAIDRLIQLLAKLPGLGPRSARRAALNLLKKRETLMQPLHKTVSRLSHGVPVGGELDLLDDGTLFAALQSRRPS